jgi:hypothetical protein
MVSKDVQGFFNVNCTNFAQSLAFYQLVGFEKILDFDDAQGPVRSFGQAGLGPVLGLPDDCDGRAALLALSGESGSTRLDLIEWKQPKLPAERRKSLAQPGIARIASRPAIATASIPDCRPPVTSSIARPRACIWEAVG